MPKPTHIDTHVPEETIELGPSRTQKREVRRRTQNTLDELTQVLASMPPRSLASLGLDEGVIQAVTSYKKLPHGGASARQRRLVARLLRGEDVPALLGRVRRVLVGGGTADDAARTRRLETWRTRLLDEGDAGLAALLVEYPSADRQQLRQAVRAAIAERTAGKSTKKSKALYQLLSSLSVSAD